MPRDPRFPGGPQYQGMPYGAGSPGGPQGEVSRKTAQNLLLVLGGLLIAVAAIVFTVVSWGRLGIGGRAAILTGLTAVTLAVPAVLLRRKLNATAETVGVLGLALMLLDGYAAAAAGLVGSVDMWDYTAATIAVVALAAALYARLLPLKVPLPLAVVLAQAPLPMLATGQGHGWPTAALAATVVLNAAVWSVARTRGLRVTAVICMALTGSVALLGTSVATMMPDRLLHAPSLVVLAATGFFVAFRTKDEVGRVFAAIGSATALVAAAGAPGIGLLSEHWQVVPYVVAALVVAAVARALPVRLRTPYALSGAGLALLGGLVVTPQTLLAVLDAPVTTWRDPFMVVGLPAAPVVFALLVSLPLILGRARWAAVVPAVAAVVVAPVVYGLPYLVVVGVQLAVALGFTFAAVRFRVPAAPWVAGIVGAIAVLWSLDQRPVAYAVLGALLVVWGLLYRRPAALVGAALAGSGLVWVALEGLGLPVRDSAAAGLAVGAGLALLGWYGTRAPGAGAGPGLTGGVVGGGMAEGAGGLGGGVAGGEIAGGVMAGGGVVGRGMAGGGVVGRVTAVVLASLALAVVADVLAGAFGGYLPVLDPWRGGPDFTGGRPLGLAAVGLAGVVLTLAVRPALVVLAGVVVVAAAPVAVRMPYVVVLVGMVVATAGAAWTAAGGWSGPAGDTGTGTAAGTAGGTVRRSAGGTAGGTAGRVAGRVAGTGGALWLGSLALGWALADETATLAVLPALAAIAAATGLLWRPLPEKAAPETAVGVARLERGAGFWWVVLAGVLVAGEAVAVAASLEVRAFEAYTVPFALLMLLVGAWRGRGVSSWLAYGPGLALAFGPSLLQEATPLRAFALGAAALAVTVAGAWRRLQAPALIGGATVAIVAVRELAPWIADLMGAVPRWVPMALGGLLLLVVGATYEARKRDVRRLRDAVARLR
ncbi:SCO7613 C-terminal domain-containing membrane protein [Nonomuraea roseola]|uniref:SCO7613 C-terminal domain-containing membrane protein n=1 Tax=Nonomuraea roseola TaxID=46179 RepID=A0ABV5Q1K5_9ACTN